MREDYSNPDLSEAACRGRTGEMYQDDKIGLVIAKSVCNICPVKDKCLAHALLLPEKITKFGVWGGKTPHELRILRMYMPVSLSLRK